MHIIYGAVNYEIKKRRNEIARALPSLSSFVDTMSRLLEIESVGKKHM